MIRRLALLVPPLALLQLAALLLMGAPHCHLPVPHDHWLIGGATPADLAVHIREAEWCSAGQPDDPAERGVVLSVPHPHDSVLVTLGHAALLPPLLPGLMAALGLLIGGCAGAYLSPRRLALIPLTPPPEPA
jgi:hypothetical protein